MHWSKPAHSIPCTGVAAKCLPVWLCCHPQAIKLHIQPPFAPASFPSQTLQCSGNCLLGNNPFNSVFCSLTSQFLLQPHYCSQHGEIWVATLSLTSSPWKYRIHCELKESLLSTVLYSCQCSRLTWVYNPEYTRWAWIICLPMCVFKIACYLLFLLNALE